MPNPNSSDIDLSAAVSLLKAGHVCAFPTDTVFGIGAILHDAAAIERVFEVKNRPASRPLVALCADRSMVENLVVFSPLAQKFAFLWPGALTLVLPLRDQGSIPANVNAGLDTLGVRIPDHPDLLQLIARVGQPLATSSANISGQPAFTDADQIRRYFSGQLPLLRDAGAGDGKAFSKKAPLELESTIVKIVGDKATLLRAGAISKNTLQTKTGIVIT